MSNLPRISFIHSPELIYEQSYGARFAPIWAYTLSSYIDHSAWDVVVVDLSVEDRNCTEDSQVFAFSGINQDLNSIKTTYSFLKEKFPKSTFVLGGPITWSFEKNGSLDQLLDFDHLFILDGEETLPQFLHDFNQGKPIAKIIRAPQRFPLEKARSMHFDLFTKKAHLYYGGILEVSRGCPFLCEFCDIRVLPQNNQSHTQKPAVIVEALDRYYRLGISQIQLACDNFIGDLQWANLCIDAICEWVDRTGAKLALHTWVTVNISNQPDLMRKMRKAGVTSLFIGVESFNASSIIETSKVQNKNDKNQMVEALQEIHSFGFIVAPGLIFGFDSDGPQMFGEMLKGISESGLIGGDPTFLLALPGTPLHRRMQATGRLIEINKNTNEEKSLAVHKARISKIESNIKYLQPSMFLIEGHMGFIRRFMSSSFAFAKFKKHVDLIIERENLIAVHSKGYGNIFEYLKFQLSTKKNAQMFFKRMIILLKPNNLWTVIRAYSLVFLNRKKYAGLKNHFYFWLFTWSNLLLKYSNLKASEFKIQSVDTNYDLNTLWDYSRHLDPNLMGGRNDDGVKVALQYKSTQNALNSLEEDFKSGKRSLKIDKFYKKAS